MFTGFNPECDSSSRCSTASPSADKLGYHLSPAGSYSSLGSPQSQVCTDTLAYHCFLAITSCISSSWQCKAWNRDSLNVCMQVAFSKLFVIVITISLFVNYLNFHNKRVLHAWVTMNKQLELSDLLSRQCRARFIHSFTWKLLRESCVTSQLTS